MREIRLYAEPQVSVYDKEEEQETLWKHLDDQDRGTLMTPFDDPRQALLAADGSTQLGGYRFSGVAFRQLCRLLSPGLAGVVTDMAGLRRVKDDADRDRYSTADALHIINTITQRRFRTSLEGMQMVRDSRTKVIEGIVGRGYKRLPNRELYERAHEVLQSYKQPVSFCRAVVNGRYIVLCYKGTDVLFEAEFRGERTDTYRGGFYYSNSEIGDGSVRATTALIREFDDTKSLASYRSHGGKAVHAGSGFKGRFEMLLNAVSARRPDADFLKSQAEDLGRMSLGFAGSDDDDERHFVFLTQFLQSKNLTRGVSRKILRNVMSQESFDHKPITDMRYVSRSEWSGRTAYDLYNSITRVAKGLSLSFQESLEQTAYRLMVGRLSLPKSSFQEHQDDYAS